MSSGYDWEKLFSEEFDLIVDAPRCNAKCRTGNPCKAKARENGRCRNHGGLSTGPKTTAGRAAISRAQKARWERYREGNGE
jgi:hypothetical protein